MAHGVPLGHAVCKVTQRYRNGGAMRRKPQGQLILISFPHAKAEVEWNGDVCGWGKHPPMQYDEEDAFCLHPLYSHAYLSTSRRALGKVRTGPAAQST